MRLFVAVNLPGSVRHALGRATAALRSQRFPIKWVDPDNVHLTLKFLGDVEDGREAEILDGLGSSCDGARQFVLPVGGFGAFPSARRPRVVWVGCETVPALELLQHQVERAMAELGFPLEGRPFRPHLTLGRARGRPQEMPGLAPTLDELAFHDEFLVESVDLMQSTLTAAGARYARRHAVALEPS